MTVHVCPSCRRELAEPGFCPFDGSPLRPITDSDGIETAPDPPETIAESAGPDAATAAPRYRAVSAVGDQRDAVAAVHGRPSEYDRLVGQTLDGRYHIDRKIGEGGMGVVFAASHAVIERPLAIKVLKREVMRDAATIKRFEQEARAASRIGHPNIVDVTDFGTTSEGLTFQVMEFVDGHTLAAVLRQAAPLPAARSIAIVGQLARALAAAHAKGIVHRDLKPDNIFLVPRDGRDFVKVVDFGIAKVAPVAGTGAANAPRLTRAGAVFGTPEYMAPEQAAGRGDTDARVDIYALGTILYEMLVGRVPHRCDTMVRTLAMQMLDPIDPPSQVRPDLKIAPALEAVVMKALAKKREDRYASMDELVTDLERAGPPLFALAPVPPGADAAPRFRDEPAFVQVRPRPPSIPIPPTTAAVETPSPGDDDAAPRRSRWPLVVAGVLAVGVGGLVFALVRPGGGSRRQVAAVPPDAPAVAVIVDAAPVVVADVPVDAARLVVVDASRVAVGHRDARVRAPVTDPIPLTPRGTVAVDVFTNPVGGAIYKGPTKLAEADPKLTIEQSPGTHLRLRCKQFNHEDGEVELVFDGKHPTVTCAMKRIKRCVEGLKNPLDDCPDASPE